MLVKSTLDLIGHTPLVELDPRVHGLKNISLYAKLEFLNPLGASLKDRAAQAMIAEEIAAIAADGKEVIESSSGNTAIALAVYCAMHGVPLKVVTNRIRINEPKLLLGLLQATVLETAGTSSCPDPSDPDNPLAQIERLVAANPEKYFHPSQYTNPLNSGAHYCATGPEILTDLGAQVDYLITGLGTAGSSRGVCEYLRSQNPELTAIGVVARKGHLVPGIRNADEMFEVGLFDKSIYGDIQEVDTNGAIEGAVTLCRKYGVLAGPSSGASYIAALRYLSAIDANLKERRTAVILACDRIEKYLNFIYKQRPDLFALPARKPSPSQLSAKEAAAAPEISVEQAKEWLSSNPAQRPCLLVDTRGPIAFRAGHIAGSINFPEEMLDSACESGLPFSASTRILLVCPTGEASLRFAAFLSSRGIECASLRGGFVAWRDSGSAIEKTILNQ